jgi:hypothetical protein
MMRRFIYGLFALSSSLLMAVGLPLAAKAQPSSTNNYTATPWIFIGKAGDCGTGTPAGSTNFNNGANVVSRWVNDLGNPSPSLYLQKAAATTDCSSAGANINGVSGITLTELNFDYYSADTNAHCGAGAPRFNVVTSDNATHFFGCSAGTATDAGNGWTHVTFSPADSTQAFPVIPNGVTVSSIQIVMDEQGYTHLDNISVNSQTIGRGHSPWNKRACQNNGFKNYVDNFGNTYKNFGQCVSYVTRNHHELVLSASTTNVTNITSHSSTNMNTNTNQNTQTNTQTNQTNTPRGNPTY